MMPDAPAESAAPPVNLFTAADVCAILCECGWLATPAEPGADSLAQAWCARACDLLGPHAPDRAALAGLITLVFRYDAAVLLGDVANQAVILRTGAREVIRELANRVLDGGDIDSDRFKEIIEGMKASLPYRGRALFQPIRLALAGRTGEGDLDRVILLLDAAAKLGFAQPVKGTRERMLEFCAALD
jgi:Anticodon binding domain